MYLKILKLPQSHPLESNRCVNDWEKLTLVRMEESSHCFQQFSSVLNATENENKAAALWPQRPKFSQLCTADRNCTVNHGYFYVVSEVNMRIHSSAFLHMYVWSTRSLCTLREARGHQPTALPLTPCLIPSRPGLTLKPELSWQPGRPSNITEAGHLSHYRVNANMTTSSSLYAFWGFELRSSNLCGKCSSLLRHLPVYSFIISMYKSCGLW